MFWLKENVRNFFTCYDAILECTRHFVPMFSYEKLPCALQDGVIWWRIFASALVKFRTKYRLNDTSGLVYILCYYGTKYILCSILLLRHKICSVLYIFCATTAQRGTKSSLRTVTLILLNYLIWYGVSYDVWDLYFSGRELSYFLPKVQILYYNCTDNESQKVVELLWRYFNSDVYLGRNVSASAM